MEVEASNGAEQQPAATPAGLPAWEEVREHCARARPAREAQRVAAVGGVGGDDAVDAQAGVAHIADRRQAHRGRVRGCGRGSTTSAGGAASPESGRSGLAAGAASLGGASPPRRGRCWPEGAARRGRHGSGREEPMALWAGARAEVVEEPRGSVLAGSAPGRKPADLRREEPHLFGSGGSWPRRRREERWVRVKDLGGEPSLPHQASQKGRGVSPEPDSGLL